MARNNKELDTINTFNLFHTRPRLLLEKLGFFKTTTLELKKFEDQEITRMSTAPKGINNMVLFDRVAYYRKFFGESHSIRRDENKDYTYEQFDFDVTKLSDTEIENLKEEINKMEKASSQHWYCQ